MDSTIINRENNITFRLADGDHIPDSCIHSMCRMLAWGVPDREIETTLRAIKAKVHEVIPALFQGFYIDGKAASFVFHSMTKEGRIQEMTEIREKVFSAEPWKKTKEGEAA